jgi:hypothetical protein
MEEIKDIILNALDYDDKTFLALLLQYSDQHTSETIEDWLAYDRHICPDCFCELNVYENDEHHSELVETLTFHECNRCGWGK